MTKLTRHLFNGFDDRLLSYLSEEGQQIEPEWYVCVQGITCLCNEIIAALFTKVLGLLSLQLCNEYPSLPNKKKKKEKKE